MSRFIIVVGVMLGLSQLTPARAQFVYGHSGGYTYSYHSSIRFSPYGFSAGYAVRSAYFAQPVVAPFVPLGPFGPTAFFGSRAYFGPFGPPVLFAPPVYVTPAPFLFGGNFTNPNVIVQAGVVPQRNDVDVLPRGANASDFLVIKPQRTTVPDVTRVAAVRAPGPVRAFDPFKEVVKVNGEQAEADPKKEAARREKLARASFATGDYGRAAEHFEQASASNPDDARTYFHHAQARFAAGQYAEAVARIREGLARDPKWPTAAFDPAELYADRADRYATHLVALKKAVADNPGEATLEFLLGYQLWFSGEKAEANKLFRAAEKRLAAPGPIALFK